MIKIFERPAVSVCIQVGGKPLDELHHDGYGVEISADKTEIRVPAESGSIFKIAITVGPGPTNRKLWWPVAAEVLIEGSLMDVMIFEKSKGDSTWNYSGPLERVGDKAFLRPIVFQDLSIRTILKARYAVS